MTQFYEYFDSAIKGGQKLGYLLYLPEGYASDPNKQWPLILFLHGIGERGTNLELVKAHGVPKIVNENPNFPFIVVSPQCPQQSYWTQETATLSKLLDDIETRYRVDPSRVYLTGLSMGGYGTWRLAAETPNRFAAIAPICGGGDVEYASRLKDLPTWVFHGAKDEVVRISESIEMVEALRSVGGDPTFTIYPEADHDSWTETYNNPALYEWFLKNQHRY